MKYLKTYEELSNLDEFILRDKIKTAVDDEDDDELDLDDCPFITELNILHQKDHIKDIFEDITNWNIEDLTFDDFKRVYNILVIEAKTKILKSLKDNPELYTQYKQYIYIDVPEETIKKAEELSTIKKYNL